MCGGSAVLVTSCHERINRTSTTRLLPLYHNSQACRTAPDVMRDKAVSQHRHDPRPSR